MSRIFYFLFPFIIYSATWIKTFANNFQGRSVCETHDNGYIVVANQKVFKVDTLGEILWSKTYSNVTFSYILQEDTNYILIGKKVDSVWLLKINSLCDTLLTKTYAYNANINYAMKTNDNYYLLVGASNGLFLMKLDSLFSLQWSKIYGEEMIKGKHCSETIDSNYIVAGGNGDYSWLFKITKNGDTLWTKRYCFSITGPMGGEYGVFATQNEDSGYTFIIGTTDYNHILNVIGLIGIFAKLDSIGDVISFDWIFTWPNRVRKAGSNYILTGVHYEHWYDIDSTIYNLKIEKIDSNSQSIWQKEIQYWDYSEGFDIRQTSDSGYIVVGDYSNGIVLIKTDSTGYFGIEERKDVFGKEVKIYPNPFVKETKIIFKDKLPDCMIYDLIGRVVEKPTSNVICKNLPNGIYFLKAKGYKAIKLIKLGNIK